MCVNQGHNRSLHPRRQLHQAATFAIALGPGHAEVTAHGFFGAAPFLVTNHQHRLAIERPQPPHATDDGFIVSEGAIAVQLEKLVEHARDVIQRVRPQLMPR